MSDPQGESALVMLAEEQVNRLIKAKAAPKWWSIALASIIGFIVIGYIILSVVVYAVHSEQRQLDAQQLQFRQDAVQACETGNAWLAKQTAIWVDLFQISFRAKPPDKHSKVYKLDEEFLHFILKTNAPRNCAHTYGGTTAPYTFGPPPAGPGNP